MATTTGGRLATLRLKCGHAIPTNKTMRLIGVKKGQQENCPEGCGAQGIQQVESRPENAFVIPPATSCKDCKRDFEVGELIHVDKKTGEATCDPCDEDMWHADPAGDTYKEAAGRQYTRLFGGV